jgi:hypothetical protein
MSCAGWSAGAVKLLMPTIVIAAAAIPMSVRRKASAA